MLNRELVRWQEMMDSCYDPSHPTWQFHGRYGVVVEPRWLKFEDFLADIGLMPGFYSRLDRAPGTDCFSSATTNWRFGMERRLTFEGDTKTLSEWASSAGIPKSTLATRISKNLPLGVALESGKLSKRNLEGMRVGMLSVISHKWTRRSVNFWRCKCDCGKLVTLASSLVLARRVRSCGCVPSLQVPLCDTHTKLLYGTKTRKITEWAGVCGVSATLIAKRIRAGWSAEEALGYKVKEQLKGTRKLSYLSGVPESTVRNRRKIGLTTREVMSASPVARGKLWTYDGLSMTLGQWAAFLNEEEATLRSRLYHGWPIAEVLRQPSRGKV